MTVEDVTEQNITHQNVRRNGPIRVGIGGPVGAGKTSMTEALCRYLAPRISMAVITNDIYTREDAEYLMRVQASKQVAVHIPPFARMRR